MLFEFKIILKFDELTNALSRNFERASIARTGVHISAAGADLRPQDINSKTSGRGSLKSSERV